MSNPKAAENLIPCKPGQTANPNGRPKGILKRLSESIGKDFGLELSKSDIYQLIQWALERNQGELQTIIDDPESPMFLVSIAESLLGDKKKKCIATVETVFDRVFGKPKQSTELTGKDGGPIETAIKQVIKFGDKVIEF